LRLRCLGFRLWRRSLRWWSLWLWCGLRFCHDRFAEPAKQGFRTNSKKQCWTQIDWELESMTTNLSSVSAFFFRSDTWTTGLACFGRASCCCFFSLSQFSASEHSLMTCVQ
jgi:hypothetical protein